MSKSDDSHFGQVTEEVHGVEVVRMPPDFSPFPQIQCVFCLAAKRVVFAKYLGQMPGNRPSYPEGRFAFWCDVCGNSTTLYRDDLEMHEQEVIDAAAGLRKCADQAVGPAPDGVQRFLTRIRSIIGAGGDSTDC